jgi:hypothetical protein
MLIVTRLLLPLALFFSSATLIGRYFPGRGVKWFWLARGVPALQWAARLTLAVAMALLLAPAPMTAAFALALFLAHIGILTYAKAKMP